MKSRGMDSADKHERGKMKLRVSSGLISRGEKKSMDDETSGKDTYGIHGEGVEERREGGERAKGRRASKRSFPFDPRSSFGCEGSRDRA